MRPDRNRPDLRSHPLRLLFFTHYAVTHLNGVQKHWYDGNGNMTRRLDGATTYDPQGYDVENRLVSVNKVGTGTTAFAYDAAGQRTQTSTPSNTISQFPFAGYEVTFSTARLDSFDSSAANWIAQGGSWAWSGSQYYSGNGGGSNANTVSLFDPQKLSSDGGTLAASIYILTTYGDQNGYLVFDYQDSSHYKYVGVNAVTDQLIFGRRSGGSDTTLATVASAVNALQWYDVKLVVSSGVAKLYVDGTYKGEYNYGSFMGQSAGVRVSKGQSYFDNFLVSAGESARITYSLAGQAVAIHRAGSAAQDNFDDGNANGWTVNSGSWSVVSNTYRQADTAASHTSRLPVGQSGPMTFEWTANFVSGSAKAGLYFFTDDTGPSYNSAYLVLQTSTDLEIWEVVGGVFYKRANVALAAGNGQSHHYKATYNPSGGAIAVWRNGVQQVSWTDTTPRGGGSYIALRTTTSQVKFDNIRVTAAGEFHYLHTDHLGSTSRMSDSSGSIVLNTMAYYLPFGGFRGTTPSAALSDQWFTGHQHNNLGTDDIGLIYMRARFYVPGIGRFASADTIVPDPTNPQSYNRYTYSYNNPVNFTDPTGHKACSFTNSGECIDSNFAQILWANGIKAVCEQNPGYRSKSANEATLESVVVRALMVQPGKQKQSFLLR